MELFGRDIVETIISWMDQPEITVLLGARQVGKTSIMKLLIDGMGKRKFLYLDLEDTYNLNLLGSVDIFLSYIKTQGIREEERPCVFIDEIQHLTHPSNFLKLIHDHHPEIKLIVSGSSSFDIRKKFGDELTGRKIVFEIFPLNFHEFLLFKKSEYVETKKKLNLFHILTNNEDYTPFKVLGDKIIPFFEEYVLFGGYPLPTLTAEEDKRILRLKEIYNTYVHKDIKDLAHIDNILEFNKCVSFLSIQISNLLNLHKTSKEISISRRDVEYYLSILEKTFVLKLAKPFYHNRQKEITKMAKIYFMDTGLRNINIDDLRPLDLRQDKGALVENVIYAELIKKKSTLQEIHFWRTKDKKEIDFIVLENRQPIPVEVKYQNFNSPAIPGPLKNFILKYSPAKGVVITKNYLEKTKYSNTEMYFIPAWMA